MWGVWATSRFAPRFASALTGLHFPDGLKKLLAEGFSSGGGGFANSGNRILYFVKETMH